MISSNSADAAGARSSAETGMALMAVAMLLVPGLDAIAKTLTATLAPAQIAWGRFLFQTLTILPVLWLSGRTIRTGRPLLHGARGFLLAGALLLIIWAFQYLPLANAIAIFFVEPLILTLLSAAFLGERIGARRLAAVAVGLVGALIVIRPNWAMFGWAAVLPLGAAVCFAGYLALTRHSGDGEHPLAMQLWAGLAATLGLTAIIGFGDGTGIGPIDPVLPAPHEWALLVGLGAFSATTHVTIAFAFRFAEAGILAPFQYLEIISATLLGLLFFGEFPDAMTWAGTALIVAAGLYVFIRERRQPAAGAVP
ncbi:DMT family transporter [Halofilum ochraceum]|uniref:DMT family transporter n=1 Tax=Halofilum ochraceum TaxID=1611323 RepID=UPI001C30270C|nr:DMT family transporter [Halofilum ochraceum]